VTIFSRSASVKTSYVLSSCRLYTTCFYTACTSSMPPLALASSTSQKMLVHDCWSSGKLFCRRSALQKVDFPVFKSPVTKTLLKESSILSQSESRCFILEVILPSRKDAIDAFSKECTSSKSHSALNIERIKIHRSCPESSIEK
jgi:hypothetical protein